MWKGRTCCKQMLSKQGLCVSSVWHLQKACKSGQKWTGVRKHKVKKVFCVGEGEDGSNMGEGKTNTSEGEE